MSGAHIHLILNHTPVVGSIFALLLLACAFIWQSDPLKRAGLAATVIVALLAIPTYLTGEPAWEDIMTLPGENDSFIRAHMSGAQIAFGAASLTGLVALIALLMSRKQRPVPRGGAASVLILLLITTGLMGWVANLGGMIRHTEIRGAGPEQEEGKK
jgi:hypothetical protein